MLETKYHLDNKVHLFNPSKWRNSYTGFCLKREFAEYRQQKTFNNLSSESLAALNSEYEALRKDAYQEALKGEVNNYILIHMVLCWYQAKRLGCTVQEVRAPSPILPLDTDKNKESVLLRLDNEILVQVLQHLDTIDVFRLTLVCKKFKSLVYNYPKELRRVEHVITTHLITFTDWMDLKRPLSRHHFFDDYLSFSWNLIKWYCGISDNLESLVLDQAFSHLELVSLLQSCKNLKSLVINNKSRHRKFFMQEPLPLDVQLPKVKLFCSCAWYDYHIAKLNRDILASSKKLRAFRGPLTRHDLESIDSRRPSRDLLQTLIALDLTQFSPEILELFLDVENIRLKYLKLGQFVDSVQSYNHNTSLVRSRDLLHQLLPRAKELEVLVICDLPGVNNTTFQLMTQIKINLSFAVFHESWTSSWENKHGENHFLTNETLIAFQEMLLSRNPNQDLSKLTLIVKKNNSWKNLRVVEKGMNVRQYKDIDYFTEEVQTGLNNPVIRRYLGNDF
eukprot:g6092.t1